MCDTITVFASAVNSFFAKNSDRDPAEFQFVYLSEDPVKEFFERPYQYKKSEYINNSFQKLKDIFEDYKHPYRAVISKPDWIWGAEMGVNEYGLAIGNEAVFSREKVAVDGLLGMDILRLALHNCRNCQEALAFIIDIIERYPQGGNGSYSGKLYYHNSFLLKDFNKAYILETSGSKWVVKEIDGFDSISNNYIIRDDYQKSSENTTKDFKGSCENRIMSFFSRGSKRQQQSYKYLQENDINLDTIFSLMRSHKGNSSDIKRGMTSICMHPGLFIRNETSSSMVVEYMGDKFITWFTASPNPCISLYKPLFINSKGANPFSDLEYAYRYSKKWRQYSKEMISDLAYFQRNIKDIRDEVEEEMKQKIARIFTNNPERSITTIWEKALNMAEDYLKDLKR